MSAWMTSERRPSDRQPLRLAGNGYLCSHHLVSSQEVFGVWGLLGRLLVDNVDISLGRSIVQLMSNRFQVSRLECFRISAGKHLWDANYFTCLHLGCSVHTTHRDQCCRACLHLRSGHELKRRLERIWKTWISFTTFLAQVMLT